MSSGSTSTIHATPSGSFQIRGRRAHDVAQQLAIRRVQLDLKAEVAAQLGHRRRRRAKNAHGRRRVVRATSRSRLRQFFGQRLRRRFALGREPRCESSTRTADSRAPRDAAAPAARTPRRSCRTAATIAGASGLSVCTSTRPPLRPAAGAAGDLRHELKRPLGRAEIGQVQRRVGVDTPTSVTFGKSSPWRSSACRAGSARRPSRNAASACSWLPRPRMLSVSIRRHG